VELSAIFSATVPLDQVVSYRRAGVENPPTVSYGSSVKLIISKGPPPVPVPQVSGTFAQAESVLLGAGFKVTQAQEFSTTVPAGQVTRTSPVVGTLIQKDTTVTVFISQGPPLQKVPDLTGKTVASATRQLSGLGLRVGAVYGPPGGRVFQTSPGSGTPKKVGSIVNLYVR
jgi:serine/threonine-protein kinase